MEHPVFRTRNLIVQDPSTVKLGTVNVAGIGNFPAFNLLDGTVYPFPREDEPKYHQFLKDYTEYKGF